MRNAGGAGCRLHQDSSAELLAGVDRNGIPLRDRWGDVTQGISTRHDGPHVPSLGGGSDTPRHAGDAGRHVPGRSIVPSGRAVVGGLLVAVAAVGTFAAWQQASGAPNTAYVVAREPLEPGQRLAADDVELQRIQLPDSVAGAAFSDEANVLGRVTLGPVGAGELLQATQLSEPPNAISHVELSFTLPRDRAVDGRLRSGDRIDVFVTRDEGTSAVLEHIQVVDVREATGPSLVANADVTVTVSLEDATRRLDLIDAVRTGDVTLVRTTNAAPPTEVDG